MAVRARGRVLKECGTTAACGKGCTLAHQCSTLASGPITIGARPAGGVFRAGAQYAASPWLVLRRELLRLPDAIHSLLREVIQASRIVWRVDMRQCILSYARLTLPAISGATGSLRGSRTNRLPG